VVRDLATPTKAHRCGLVYPGNSSCRGRAPQTGRRLRHDPDAPRSLDGTLICVLHGADDSKGEPMAIATDADITRHEGSIRDFAHKLFPDQGESENYEDVCQAGRIGILEAYRKSRLDPPRASYVLDYVKARMENAFRSLTQTRPADEISLDSLMGCGGDDEEKEDQWEPASHHDTEAEALERIVLADTLSAARLTDTQTKAVIADMGGETLSPGQRSALRNARRRMRRMPE